MGVKAASKPEAESVPISRSKDPLKDNDGWINGKFRLLEKLGEGGFGLVYKAEQTQPIQRFVALKILKAGMDTQQVSARFDTERQSLALMEHPNISRVLDGGETERGLPYFVMELVRGRSITVYAKNHQLSIEQRIELFIPVCQAVNHAHQKGIIHRDLKPSNVMIMEDGESPVPKVIDFGIAKVLEQKELSQTLMTGMDQLVGTPGFISPEQILHGSSHVDTRSDVYALGSILMELLTGKPLINAMDLMQKPMHQILRDQVELDPPRPSSREPLLKGDLDWIILKALEKEPARRYRSADELADDLRRFLHDQPVLATPPSRRYLMGKFVRRHRVGVAAGLAVALAILIGGITSTALYFMAERNRAEADLGRENLRKEFSRSDEQMAHMLAQRTDYSDAVAWLCRALRTDAGNSLAATNLLTLLEHEHLLHPITPAMPLPADTVEARLIAVSRLADRVLAVSSPQPAEGAQRQEVLSIWDISTHERRDHLLPLGVVITALQMTENGQHCYVAQDDGQVMLWSLKEQTSQPLLPAMPSLSSGQMQSVLCLALSANGQTLVAGGDGGSVILWDRRQVQVPGVLLVAPDAGAKSAPITHLALEDGGKVVAVASNAMEGLLSRQGGVVRVWDVTNQQPLGEAIQVDDGIGVLAINREREMLAIGLHSGAVHVLNYRLSEEILPDLQHPSTITSLTLNPKATILTAGDGNGYLHTWNLRNGRPHFPAQAHDGEIVLTHETATSGLITSISRHGDLQIWDTLTNQRVHLRLQHSVAEVSLTDDASVLALAPRYEPYVQVWSIHQRMCTRRFLTGPDDPARSPPALSPDAPELIKNAATTGWNPNRTLAATADKEGRVVLRDGSSGKALGAEFQHPPAVGAVALSADGHLAITSGRDQEIRLWDGITGKSKGITIRPGGFVSELAVSPDSQRLVTLTDEGELRVWDTTQGYCLTPAIHLESKIDGLRVTADAQRIEFRVIKQGWFSLPMPPAITTLPTWFLDLAEALARRRLSTEGKYIPLGLGDVQQAIAAVPTGVAKGEETAMRWAKWLLKEAENRPLAPTEDEPLDTYLKSLQRQPAAAAELRRFRPILE
jgi:eukaryotic-like serine/threonine-protein kinase